MKAAVFLSVADGFAITGIAFPAISTSIYGFPEAPAAKIAATADFSSGGNVISSSICDEIHAVCERIRNGSAEQTY
jgi:hypothetical protein